MATQVGAVQGTLEADAAKWEAELKRAAGSLGMLTQRAEKTDDSLEKVEGSADGTTRSLGRLSNGARSSDSAFSALGGGLGKVAGAAAALTGLYFGAKGIISAVTTATDAANVQREAEVKLASAIRGSGQAIDANKIKAYAAELQGLTTFGDEATIGAAAMLTTFGLNEKAILGLLPRVQNLSAMFGTSLVDSAKLVGRAMTSGAGALSRVGVTLTDVQKAAFDAADGTEKAALLMEILDSNTGNAAEALAAATGGAVQLENAYGDLLESIGEMIQTDQQGWFRDLASAIGEANEAFREFFRLSGTRAEAAQRETELASDVEDISRRQQALKKDIALLTGQFKSLEGVEDIVSELRREGITQELDNLRGQLRELGVEMQSTIETARGAPAGGGSGKGGRGTPPRTDRGAERRLLRAQERAFEGQGAVGVGFGLLGQTQLQADTPGARAAAAAKVREGVQAGKTTAALEQMTTSAAALRDELDTTTLALPEMTKSVGEAREEIRKLTEQEIADFGVGLVGILDAAIAGRGFQAAGAELGGAVGGGIGGLFGPGGAAIGQALGSLLGGLLGNLLDELVEILGVLAPIFDALAVVVRALSPIFIVLAVFTEEFGHSIELLAPIIAPTAEALASLLLIVVRLLQGLLILNEAVLVVMAALFSYPELITLAVQLFDQFVMRPLISAMLVFLNTVIGVNDSLVLFTRNLISTTSGGTVDASGVGMIIGGRSTFVEDPIADFATSLDDLRNLGQEEDRENRDAMRDNTEALKEVARTIQNIPDIFNVPRALLEVERGSNGRFGRGGQMTFTQQGAALRDAQQQYNAANRGGRFTENRGPSGSN